MYLFVDTALKVEATNAHHGTNLSQALTLKGLIIFLQAPGGALPVMEVRYPGRSLALASPLLVFQGTQCRLRSNSSRHEQLISTHYVIQWNQPGDQTLHDECHQVLLTNLFTLALEPGQVTGATPAREAHIPMSDGCG